MQCDRRAVRPRCWRGRQTRASGVSRPRRDREPARDRLADGARVALVGLESAQATNSNQPGSPGPMVTGTTTSPRLRRCRCRWSRARRSSRRSRSRARRCSRRAARDGGRSSTGARRVTHHRLDRGRLGGELADVVIVEPDPAPPCLVAAARTPQVAVAAFAIVDDLDPVTVAANRRGGHLGSGVRNKRPAREHPPRDIESSGGFSTMPRSGGFSTMVSVAVSATRLGKNCHWNSEFFSMHWCPRLACQFGRLFGRRDPPPVV